MTLGSTIIMSQMIYVPWMKKWYDKDSFKYSKDTSMHIYKNKIDLNESYCSVNWRKSLLNPH